MVGSRNRKKASVARVTKQGVIEGRVRKISRVWVMGALCGFR